MCNRLTRKLQKYFYTTILLITARTQFYYPVMGMSKGHRPTRFMGNSFISMRSWERKRTNGTLGHRGHGLIYCRSSLSSKTDCSLPQHSRSGQTVFCAFARLSRGENALHPWWESPFYRLRMAHGCTAPSQFVTADGWEPTVS